MKKKLTSMMMILSLLLSLFITASANDGIAIYVNDEILHCDIAPFIKDGRTMVPMRKIFEALDAKVEWEGSTQTITASKDDIQIVLNINDSTMYNNGVAESLDVAPIIVDSSTFVPIRAVSQSLNASVEWFGHTQTVYINSMKTYNDEYNSFLDSYMQATVPAGYEWIENVTDNASVHADICVQGSISDIQVKDEDIYLIMDNRYSQGEKIAIYLANTESTSIEKMTELFKNTNISVGGRYLGVTDAFNTPVISMQYVSIFESDSWYEVAELIYPKLSLLGQTVTLYNWDNQSLDVPATQVNEYLEVGWTTEKQVTMYAPDGRTIVVAESEVEAHRNVGWYLNPVTTMYAPDGRTIVVAESEVEAHRNVGWYLNPVTTMYAPDGRTIVVAESEVEAHRNVGWYLHPVTTMYAPDGRTAVVGENEVYDYKNVGWYETYAEAQSAKDSTVKEESDGYYSSWNQSTGNTDTEWNATDSNEGITVYIGYTGSKYHTKNCRTLKNGAIPISLAEAKAEGREACKVCH